MHKAMVKAVDDIIIKALGSKAKLRHKDGKPIVYHKWCMTCSTKLRLVDGTNEPEECYDCGIKRIKDGEVPKPPKGRGLCI